MTKIITEFMKSFGIKLLGFCVTLKLHFLCAEFLYLPVKGQWSRTLSKKISFPQIDKYQ